MAKLLRTTKDFDQQVKRLEKRHRLIGQDILRFGIQLQKGERQQDFAMKRVRGARVMRARIPNTSARQGTRSGFRLTYVIRSRDIWLLHIGVRRDNDGVNPRWISQALDSLPPE